MIHWWWLIVEFPIVVIITAFVTVGVFLVKMLSAWSK